MKRFFLLLIATLNYCNIFAIDQECIVYHYNGKELRTPLGGVYVKVTNSPNGAVSQENTGHLILKLQGLILGDAIENVIVRKEGMMVFNKEDVGRWHVQKEPLVLILCDAKDFQKRKEQLIEIGRNLTEKKYKQKMEQLKTLNVKQQLSIEQYYAKSDSIDNKKRNTLAHMDEYADMLAHIDESELDTLSQRGVELFNQGQFEEAIRLFEQENYLEKLEDALMVKSQTEGMCQKMDTALMVANKDIEEYTKSILTQVKVYKVKKEWAKAGELLKDLADRLQTLDVVGDYADFALSQKRYDEAEKYLKLYIDKSKLSDQSNGAVIAKCYIKLAYVSMFTKKFVKAKEYSIEALKADAANHAAYIYIAAAFLLQGEYAEAELICRQYKSELKNDFLKEMDEFSKAGVIPTDKRKDVKKIKKILKE